MVVRLPETKKYLNRDGLEEYNSLLPHSSEEMQEYVNDWLDEHPEATTTVQDSAISEPKLADKSVSLRTLADDTVHMLKGMMFTREISGSVLSADDAYSAPPVELTVDGKSTQDGTPTPDAPVEIVSIEQVGLNVAGFNLFNEQLELGKINTTTGENEPSAINLRTIGAIPITAFGRYYCYVGDVGQISGYLAACYYDADGNFATYRVVKSNDILIVPLNAVWMRFFITHLYGTTYKHDICINADSPKNGTYEPFTAYMLLNLTHALRSLPDGTHDTLSFAYLRPSTREGWAWYSAEHVQNVGKIGIGTTFDVHDIAINADDTTSFIVIGGDAISHTSQQPISNIATLGGPTTSRIVVSGGNIYMRFSSDVVGTTKNAIDTYLNEHCVLLYHAAAPISSQLDPVELPILPAPSFNIWSDPSTGLQMEYVRDSNIVIQRIEEAIADL